MQELGITAVIAILFAAYWLLARYRRNLANAVHRRTGIAAFAVAEQFERDIPSIALDPTLKRSAFALAVVTLALFIITGFVDFGDTRALACAVALIWIAFACWAASRIAGELEFVVRADGPFSAAELPGNLDDDGRLVLVRRLVREGLLRVRPD